MMKFKMIAMIALTLSMVTACSQNSNPTGSYPYGGSVMGNQYGYQTGYNGINSPYMNNGMMGAQNPYLFVNYSYANQPRLNLQAQAMFSLNLRSSTPNFYNPLYANNNCMMRNQVNYTPSNCACTVAPCNCQQVLTQIREESQATERSCSTCSTTSSRSRSRNRSSTDRANRDTTSDTSETRSDQTDTRTTRNDEVINTNNSKIMSLTVTNADARALFNLLAKAPEVSKDETIVIRTGSNYKCILNGKGVKAKRDRVESKDENYACDFDVNLEDGSLYQLYPIGLTGLAVNTNGAIYEGKNVSLGGPGLNPTEGSINVKGSIALAIYKRLPGVAVAGYADTEQKITAEVKSGKTVKCFKTTNTTNTQYGCSMLIKADTGESRSI